MEIKVNKVFHELEISDVDTDNRSIRLLTGQEKKNYDPRKEYLTLYTSLMASPSGLFCKDLKKNKAVTHHFEWQFGVSAPSAVSPVSDWVGALTSKADKQDAAKYENRIKNMFRLFRFLTDKGEQGIEYVLTKDVLSQWGTFLKGSFNICFVRDASGPAVLSPYRIKLLPKLGFKKNDHLCYLPSPEQAEAVKAELVIEVKG